MGSAAASRPSPASPRARTASRLLNSAVENAFATPGGYIYITRQLMALMDNEAELAFALGARSRARRRQSCAGARILRTAKLGSGTCWVPSWAASSAAGSEARSPRCRNRARSSRRLSFSRNQEYQADTLGMRYMIGAGYDPVGASGVLAAITRADRARSPSPGARQPPDAGMGEHPSARREPRAERADRG